MNLLRRLLIHMVSLKLFSCIEPLMDPVLQTVCSCPLTLHEGEDLLVLLFGLTLLHQVNLVLQDEDVLQLHDLYGCQVL